MDKTQKTLTRKAQIKMEIKEAQVQVEKATKALEAAKKRIATLENQLTEVKIKERDSKEDASHCHHQNLPIPKASP